MILNKHTNLRKIRKNYVRQWIQNIWKQSCEEWLVIEIQEKYNLNNHKMISLSNSSQIWKHQIVMLMFSLNLNELLDQNMLKLKISLISTKKIRILGYLFPNIQGKGQWVHIKIKQYLLLGYNDNIIFKKVGFNS